MNVNVEVLAAGVGLDALLVRAGRRGLPRSRSRDSLARFRGDGIVRRLGAAHADNLAVALLVA